MPDNRIRAVRKAIEAGVKAAFGPNRYAAAGKPIVCSHCGGEEFDRGEALLNSQRMTLIGLDWADREATVLVCTVCSRIEWFAKAPDLR